MSTSSASDCAASTATDFQSFSCLSVEPILQFIRAECVAFMPASGMKVTDFMIQVLTENKERLDGIICGSSSCKQHEKHASNQILQKLLSSGASPSAQLHALSGADESELSVRIHDLEAEVRELKALLSVSGCNVGPFALQSTLVDGCHSPAPAYADHIALSAQRRDKSRMQEVFNRHMDVEGKGLSKAALMAALKEVAAPVLSSSDGASEDSLFRRADTNLSNYVDSDECGGTFDFMCCVCYNAVACRFFLVVNLPDDLEMFLADHSLGVSAVTAMPLLRACHSLRCAVCCAVAQSTCGEWS
jgi:hypothetical protein